MHKIKKHHKKKRIDPFKHSFPLGVYLKLLIHNLNDAWIRSRGTLTRSAVLVLH